MARFQEVLDYLVRANAYVLSAWKDVSQMWPKLWPRDLAAFIDELRALNARQEGAKDVSSEATATFEARLQDAMRIAGAAAQVARGHFRLAGKPELAGKVPRQPLSNDVGGLIEYVGRVREF